MIPEFFLKMHPCFFLLLLAYATASCTSQSDNLQSSSEAEKPNIVLLFTDDQTYESIEALNNTEIHTPNLNRLFRGGSTFTHAFNMGGWNGAVCIASRSMMISGQAIWRAKQQDSLWRAQDSTALAQTWGRLMQRQGYRTYMSGKWHVQAPADVVFDTVRHERPGMPPDNWGRGGGGRQVAEAIRAGGDIAAAMPPGYNRPLFENDRSWSPTDTTFGGFWEGGKHWSEVLKDDALLFIEDASSQELPFFMYLAFNAPHDPRQAPQEYVDMYSIKDISLPESFMPEYPWKDSIGNGVGLRDEALAPFPRTPYAVKKHRQEYYAIISHLDAQIGQILDALEESGKMENTYIFFTADHGLAVGQHGLIGKQNMYDHSIRVPMMVMGPGIPAGKKFDQEVYLQDVMATSLELAGIEKPSYVDFHSFMDIINGERAESHYNEIYGAYIDYQRMIRKDGFKLIVYPRIDKVLLYDLNKDPEEMHDLAAEPAYADKVKEMYRELLELQQEMGDSLSLSGSFSL
jgi:arylsulfatase A-like enzyme